MKTWNTERFNYLKKHLHADYSEVKLLSNQMLCQCATKELFLLHQYNLYTYWADHQLLITQIHVPFPTPFVFYGIKYFWTKIVHHGIPLVFIMVLMLHFFHKIEAIFKKKSKKRNSIECIVFNECVCITHFSRLMETRLMFSPRFVALTHRHQTCHHSELWLPKLNANALAGESRILQLSYMKDPQTSGRVNAVHTGECKQKVLRY